MNEMYRQSRAQLLANAVVAVEISPRRTLSYGTLIQWPNVSFMK